MSVEKLHIPNQGELIQFPNMTKKQEAERLLAAERAYQSDAISVGTRFSWSMYDYPNKTISDLSLWMEDMDHVISKYYGISIDKSVDCMGLISDTLSLYYTDLTSDQRKSIVVDYLNYFDKIDCCAYIQKHIAVINNARMIRDIIVNANRPDYWPGVDEDAEVLQYNPNLSDFSEYLSACMSTGLMGYVIAKKDIVSLPIRHYFKQNHSDILDGSLDLAASMIYHDGVFEAECKGADLIDAIETGIADFDPTYSNTLRQKIVKADWFYLDSSPKPANKELGIDNNGCLFVIN